MHTFCFKVLRLILIRLNSYFILSAGFMDLTFVVAPPFKVRSTGLFVCHPPRVKSGMSTVLDFLATERSLNGIRQLHAAASYTSWSSGKPLRRQSISRQSIMKSIPPWPPTSLAMAPIWLMTGGEYFLYRSSSYSFLIQLWPKAILSGPGHFCATPFVPLIKWILE